MKHIKILMLFCTVLSVRAYADAYIPPTAPQVAITQAAHGTPVEHSMFNNHSWNKTDNTIKRNPHFGSTKATAGTVTATKTHPATFTGKYGEKATGSVTTQTNAGSTSAINKAGTAVMAGAIAGNIMNSPNATTAAEELGKGNFGAAAAHAAAALDWTGIGGGINGLKDAFNRGANAEAKAAAQAKAQAAAEQAQEAYKKWQAAQTNNQQYLPDPITGKPQAYPTILQWSGGSSGAAIIAEKTGGSGGTYGISEMILKSTGVSVGVPGCESSYECKMTSFQTITVTKDNYVKYKDLITEAIAFGAPKPTIEDFMLTQNELSNIIAQYLQKNLESNEALRNDILTMLWSSGELNPNNTQTAVTGSAGDNTFLTPPYTPAGSQQAQQTQFKVAPDGTVTATTIPRPDLSPNTSQAPTRQEVGLTNTATQTQTQAPKEQASASAPDICAMNPNSLMCAEMGSADYEDIVLPENKINLDFEPTNTFSTDGICPAPKTFNVYGSTFNLSYQPACDFARGARPMIIMLGMVIAMGMAYAAVKEL